MRPLMGTGEIGDSVSCAMFGGVVTEIGPTRTFTAVNPANISQSPPPDQSTYPSCVTVSATPSVLPDGKLTMTAHQRQYQWPDVGPVNLAGKPPGVSRPPVEYQEIQAALPVVTVVPIEYAPVPQMPTMGGQLLDNETVLPQRGGSLRESWTLYKTAPWSPTVFVKENLLSGDTRRYTIKGVTKNNLGAPLAGVTVLCLNPAMLVAGQPSSPIVSSVVSDGSGTYEFTVNPNLLYELHAYINSTNVGGISLNNLRADATVDIYCTQPGVAPPVAGGGGGPLVGSSAVISV